MATLNRLFVGNWQYYASKQRKTILFNVVSKHRVSQASGSFF